MTTSKGQAVSSRRVPVSTTETITSILETLPKRFDRVSRGKQAFLIGLLVHKYGWVLGQDGNLYAPDSSMAWGERVA
jgi:hypothetical protein